MSFKSTLFLAFILSSVLFGCSTAINEVNPDAPDHLSDRRLRYHNAQYNFTFSLPASWKGYSVLTQQWDGENYSPALDKTVVTEHGSMFVLRNPQWKAGEPCQDIPVLVFTRSQWDALHHGKLWPSLYAGGVMDEMWHNHDFVFGICSRYNADDSVKGWQEAADILRQNYTANHAPHLYAE